MTEDQEVHVPAEIRADVAEADAFVQGGKIPLPERRPAELTTFIAGLVAVAAGFNIDLSSGLIVGIFAVLATLPAIVSWLVSEYRESIYGEPLE